MPSTYGPRFEVGDQVIWVNDERPCHECEDLGDEPFEIAHTDESNKPFSQGVHIKKPDGEIVKHPCNSDDPVRFTSDWFRKTE